MAREELSQEQVDEILDGYGIEHVILGHTKSGSIKSLYDDRVIAIDLYHIVNFGNGYMEALQFELGCFYVFRTDGMSQEYTPLIECDALDDNYLELNGKDQLQIYPNPTSSFMTVEMPSQMLGDYNYTILNMEGRRLGNGVVNQLRTTIAVGEYGAGKYILKLQNSERTIIGHFILKN